MNRSLVRAVQTLGYGLLFLAILVCIPSLCIRYVGWPLPTSFPDGPTAYDWIENPFTPRRSAALLSIVGWIVWGLTVYVLVGELTARLGRFRRLPRLRIGPLQGLVAGMVGATAVTAPAAAHPAPAPPSPAIPDTDPTTALQPTGAVATDPVQSEPTYIVEHGDWLSAVAARFLANPDAYPTIEALNPELKARDPRFPHHIEPGWRIRLPANARDHGIRLHAAGTFIPAPEADPQPTPPLTATPQPPPPVTQAPAPPPASNPEPADGASSILDDGEPDVVVGQHSTGAMAGAGLIAAMLLALLTAERRRQRSFLVPGEDPPVPRSRRAERELRIAQLPADVERLTAALRDLGCGLASRNTLPDIVGVRLVGRDVQVLLAQPDDSPPAPWLDEGTQWALPGYIDPEESTNPPTVLPLLVTVGSRAGRHLHLDLHRLGTLSITGHPYRSRDLLRHVVCDLACAPWADGATVLLAGFGDEGDALVDIQPARLTTVASTTEAITAVRAELHRRTDSTTATPPLVLAVANPTAQARTELAALHHDLVVAGQCGVAVIVATGDSPPVASPSLTIAADGSVRVDVPGLRLTTDAAVVPVDMLEPLAQVLRTARLTHAVTEAAPTPGPSLTDEDHNRPDQATTLLAIFDADALPPVPPPVTRNTQPQTTDAAPDSGHADPDHSLDVDVAAWFDADPTRPRLAILGPIRVAMPGVITDSKHRLYTEMLLYLLTRPDRSCDRAQMENALWYGHPAGEGTIRAAMARLRRWMGSRPGSGEWISEGTLPHGRYTAADGILLDWHLLLRLRDRGDRRGTDGAADYRIALRLVRGPAMQDRPDTSRYRRPYTWIDDSEINPTRILATITDIAHRLATHSLDIGDTDTARWAVQQAWLADPDRGYDDLWIDYMRAEHADGRTATLHSLIDQFRHDRGAEVLEDLQPRTYKAIHDLLSDRA